MRKKKLAIFTAAVGFFTLCNVFIYTKRLRADEMARFWHWSGTPFFSPSNYNANRLNSSMNSVNIISDGCHFALNNTNGNVSLVDDLRQCSPPTKKFTDIGHQKSATASNLNTTENAAKSNSAAAHNKTESNLNKSSSAQVRAYFVLQNQTYIVDLNGTEVFTELKDPTHNRTLTLTFSQSLFEREDKSGRLEQSTTQSTENTSLSNGNVTSTAKGITSLNLHQFQYLINVKKLCSDKKSLMLVILVATAVEHAAQRQAIRETWGSYAKTLPEVTLAFVTGRPVNTNSQSIIMKEALQYGDIIQEDFMDTYKNLTLKTVMLLKWANTFCTEAKYIMKADDDMFVNVPNLLKYVKSLRIYKSQLFGRLVKGARPLRTKSSKYYVPVSEYKDKVYPDYLSGTAYVMSADVAAKLYAVSKVTPIFFFEDVFITGICAKKAGIVRRNHIGFVYYKRPVKGCSYLRVITGHNNTPTDLRKIWKDLQKKIVKC
ncbi:hypothetical protein CHUAL_007104 [Chamberlinius hualienensis]